MGSAPFLGIPFPASAKTEWQRKKLMNKFDKLGKK